LTGKNKGLWNCKKIIFKNDLKQNKQQSKERGPNLKDKKKWTWWNWKTISIYKLLQIKQIVIKKIRIKFEGNKNWRALRFRRGKCENQEGRGRKKKRSPASNRMIFSHTRRLYIEATPRWFKCCRGKRHLTTRKPHTHHLKGVRPVHVLMRAMRTSKIIF
jgi:hypothetical protein